MPTCLSCTGIDDEEDYYASKSDSSRTICKNCWRVLNVDRKEWTRKFSEAHRRKLSELKKGKIPSHIHLMWTPEARAKISASKKGKPSPKKGIPTGKPSWNKGKQTPEEIRRKISNSREGLVPWNKSLAGTYKNGPMSEEAKKNLSEKMKGPRNPNFGKPSWNKGKTGHLSEQTLVKIRAARAKMKLPRYDTVPEKTMHEELTKAGIPFSKQKVIKLRVGFHPVDIFIEPNIVYECDGDFWHANPALYADEKVLWGGLTAKEIRENDAKITAELEAQGLTVIRHWESDIKRDVHSCVEKVKAAMSVPLIA